MGASASKIEEDRALVLCQERKRFVRAALDGRCSFAAAHFDYIQSLRIIGVALSKFAEPDAQAESSLYTSTTATPEPLEFRLKTVSQFRNASPSHSPRPDTSNSLSPDPLPFPPGKFHVNRMKAAKSLATAVKEKPPIEIKAAALTNSLDSTEITPVGATQWDFFGIFQPVENQFEFPSRRELTELLEDADDMRRLREEEGIPELEEEGDKTPASTRKDDAGDSEDDFDKPSSEPLVQMFKNRNVVSDQNTGNARESAMQEAQKVRDASKETELSPPASSMINWSLSETAVMLNNRMYESDETHSVTPIQASPVSPLQRKELSASASFTRGKLLKEDNGMLEINSYESDETPRVTRRTAVSPPRSNGRTNEATLKRRNEVKDFLSSMREIECLFIKASDCGKEVQRMLEADKVHFRPILPKEAVHRSKAGVFFTTLFSCCTNEVPRPPTTEVKYLTWHRSVSSNSSSSRIPRGATVKDEVDGLTESIFSGVYMNSGSHALTLDRLFAWEKKLYDEVKVSGFVRREYDIKCRLLQHLESRGEDQHRIDRTRAAVKDLRSRVCAAIHRIEWISQKIVELRDNELMPQLEELIGSLARMWEAMLECHRSQHEILTLVSEPGSVKLSVRSESQRQATLYLEVELKTLCANFTNWISSHRSYLCSMNSWLHKCIVPLKQKSSKRRSTKFTLRDCIGPAIFVACEDWIQLLNELPVGEAEESIRDLASAVAAFLPRQEKRHKGDADGVDAAETPSDCSSNSERLASSLAAFLEKLKNLAAMASEKYRHLQGSIDGARAAYETV